MKYVSYGAEGSAESMVLVDGPAPLAGPGEILIEVCWAGVNRPDLMQRAGRYPPPPGASPILGLEVAGRVAALGEGVSPWRLGELVTALVPGGGYAEYCLAPAAHALPIPEGMSLAEAACLPENWFTVWANLVELAHLSAGERLLVHGGASGIGLTAILLAKHLGAEVLVTVGSQEKAEFCRGFGASQAIDYRQGDFAEQVKEFTAGEGVDVVLDMVGGDYLQKDVGLLRRDGRLVLIAFLQGAKTRFDFLPVMLKRLVITGSTLRPRTLAEKANIAAALRREIWPQLGRGKCRPHLHASFPLARASEAHQLMESNRHIGKIVLEVRS